MEKYLEMPEGFRLYCEDTGEGIPVVFLHGWNSTHEVFDEAVSTLDGCRCISYDCRGHGRSGAPDNGTTLDALADDLHRVIEQCRVENVVLVGWSMGAATIWRYVRRYGCEGLAHIVLIDMSPMVLNDEEWRLGLWQGEYRFQDYMDDMTVEFTDFSKFATTTLWRKYELQTEAQEPETMENRNYHVLTALWHSMMVTDCRDDLERIVVDTDVFYGDPGDKYKPETAYWVAEHIPGRTRLVPFYGCGHGLIWQDASKFIAELKRVIESVRSADGLR